MMRSCSIGLFNKPSNVQKTRLIVVFLISQLIILNSYCNMKCADTSPFQSTSIENSKASNNTRGDNGQWTNLNLWNDNKELFTIAVGDVDLTHPGDEIVVGGESNKLTVVYGFGDTWVAETAYKPKVDDWVITSIAIGDVYPRHPGNEIVMVGWSTYVTLVYKSSDTNRWVSKRLYEAENWLYDVGIGDIDPTHPGNEIVTVGDPHHVIMINYSNETDSWSNKLIWKNTNAEVSIVAIGDFDSYHNGSELAIASVYVNLLNLTEIFYNLSTGKGSPHNTQPTAVL